MKLAIILATKNRAAKLDEALASICSPCEERSTFEVIVADNASSDDTSEVIRLYEKRSPRVKGIRQAVDIGAFANYAVAAQQTTAEWVWLFGDDDILLPGAQRHVLDGLSRWPDIDETNLILTDYVYFYDNEGAFFRRSDVAIAERDKTYPSRGRVFEDETFAGAGMLSRIVIRRKYVAPYFSRGWAGDWRNWRQIDALTAAASEGKQRVLARTCVAQRIYRRENSNWSDVGALQNGLEWPMIVENCWKRGFHRGTSRQNGKLYIALFDYWRMVCSPEIYGLGAINLASKLFEKRVIGFYLIRRVMMALKWCVFRGRLLGLRAVVPKDSLRIRSNASRIHRDDV